MAAEIKEVVYHGMCQLQSVVPNEVGMINLDDPGRVSQIFCTGRKNGHIPAGTFCNVMVFMICNGTCALPEKGQVDFAQQLGQADPRRPVHY
jgi:hypothetical protein